MCIQLSGAQLCKISPLHRLTGERRREHLKFEQFGTPPFFKRSAEGWKLA